MRLILYVLLSLSLLSGAAHAQATIDSPISYQLTAAEVNLIGQALELAAAINTAMHAQPTSNLPLLQIEQKLQTQFADQMKVKAATATPAPEEK